MLSLRLSSNLEDLTIQLQDFLVFLESGGLSSVGFSLGKKKKGKFQVNLKDSVNLQWKLLFGRGGECQDLGTNEKMFKESVFYTV